MSPTASTNAFFFELGFNATDTPVASVDHREVFTAGRPTDPLARMVIAWRRLFMCIGLEGPLLRQWIPRASQEGFGSAHDDSRCDA